MALPELPDDRRAQPRRYVPVDPSAPSRHAGGEEARQDERPGRRQAPPPGRQPLPEGRRPETAAGRLLGTQDDQSGEVPARGGRRRAEEPTAHPVNGTEPPSDADVPPRRLVDGPGRLSIDRSTLRGRPALPEPNRRNGRPLDPARQPPRAVDAEGEQFEARGAAPLQRPVETQRPVDAQRSPEPRRGEPLPGRRRAAEGPELVNGRPVAPPFAEGAPVDDPTVVARRPRRRPDPSAEAPTTAVPAGSDPSDQVRHRRRARGAADERPAAAYKELTPTDGRKARPGRRRRTSFWKELPLLIVVALLLTFLIQTFLAKVYVIPSGSMETTLHGCTGCNNDRVLVDKVTYRFSDPQPGDVVVFRGPDSWNSEIQVAPPGNVVVAALQQLGSLVGLAPPDEKDFVKRVIGVGGQTLQCCDANNRVMVDGKPLTEPYIYYDPDRGPPKQESFGPVTVPQGQLWMMGDSRNNSADSRVPGHGPVPVDDVIGKARVIVLPFPRFGWIQAYDPQQATAAGMGTPVEQGAMALGLVGVLPLWRRRRRADQGRDVVGLDGFLAR